MFFQNFWTWLTARLSAYISTHAAAVAAAIEPVAGTLAIIYVMVWGYLHLTGRIEEPIMEAARRVLTLVVVLGAALHLWAYHDVIVDTFFTAPQSLAATLVGATSPVTMVDAIWQRGGAIAAAFFDKGGLLTGDGGFYLAGAAVYVLVGSVCVYTLFLISLSRIALAILLALGPLFILCTLFPTSRRLFDAWMQELINHALVAVLTVMVATLLLDLVQGFADSTAARGGDLLTVDALNLTLAAALVLLVLMQVPPMAARLAGGFALSVQGLVDRGVYALRRAAGATLRAGWIVVDGGGATPQPPVTGVQH